MNCPEHHHKMTFVNRVKDVRSFKCSQGCAMIIYDGGKRLFFVDATVVK